MNRRLAPAVAGPTVAVGMLVACSAEDAGRQAGEPVSIRHVHGVTEIVAEPGPVAGDHAARRRRPRQPMTGIERVWHPDVLRELRVVRVRRLTPKMLRITVGGPELGAFHKDGRDLGAFHTDWPDEHAAAILRRCAAAAGPGGRVVLVELVLRDAAPDLEHLVMDLRMLVLFGPHERSRDEFAALAGRAGMELRRVLPTGSELALVELGPPA